jgi:hypothetical protein
MQEWPRELLPIWLHNASAHLHWHEPTQIPYTLSSNIRHEKTTYLMSLSSGWFDYTAEELTQRPVSAWSIRQVGKLARLMGLDQLALVGNLPISTQIHLPQYFGALTQTCNYLSRHHGSHFVGVRNLLPHRHAELMKLLRAEGFVALPSRVIYEFDLRTSPTYKPSHLSRDKSLLKKSGMQVLITRDISQAQSSRLRELYQQIYIHKHSQLNPQYTAQFFSDMINHQVMQCLQLRDSDGQIQAFALLYKIGETLTVPALGYDAQSDQNSLYRLLFASIHDYTQAHHLLLNYSSGAGDFKRKRGGSACLEYTMLRAPASHRWGQAKWLQWAQTQAAKISVNDLIALGA